ncbi:unnamed protein product [Orchesella dallaii]|uniref:Uncharacterized protein n=1 Tax=Orchesella dallaii TaxID=48710 RepID=A0ABP1S894_9HEXA
MFHLNVILIPSFSLATASLLLYNRDDAKPTLYIPIEKISNSSKYQVYIPPVTNSFKQKFGKLVNLNKFINNFYGSFITINNPIGYDLEEPNLPITLRRHVSAFNAYRKFNATHKIADFQHFIELPIEKGISLLKLNINSVQCSSPFHYGNLNYGEFCTQIKPFKFSSKAKPWNSQLHVDLFPPILGQVRIGIYKLLDGSGVWFYEGVLRKKHSKSFQTMISATNYRIIVLNQEDDEKKQMVVSWIASTFRRSRVSQYPMNFNGDQFLLLEAATQRKNSFHSVGIIETISLIKLCLSCSFDNVNAVTFLRISTIERNFQNKLETDRIMWEFPQDKSGSVVLQNTWKSCSVPYDLSLFTEYHSAITKLPLSDVAEYAYAWIIRNSLMKNATHLNNCAVPSANAKRDGCSYDRRTRCLAHVVLFTEHFTTANSYRPWAVDFPSKILRFVSCGRAQKNLGFYHLISVFEAPVWLFIIFTMLIPAPLLYFLSNLQRSKTVQNLAVKIAIHSVMAPLKALLEQGDPFSMNEVDHVPSFRWFMVPYLFCILVLSNAYKNENVYSLITPREPTPYTQFEQLVQDGFKVFTRGYFREFKPGSPCLNLNFAPLNNHTYVACKAGTAGKCAGGTFRGCIRMSSEVDYYVNQMIVAKNSLSKLNYETQLLYNYTEFLPFTPKLQNFLNEFLDYNATGYLPVYRSLQDEPIWEFLQSCNKTALILPELNCHLLAAKLNRKRENKDSVYVGKSVVLSAKIGFSFQGYLIPGLVSQMNGLGQSGIADWWRLLARDWLTRIRVGSVGREGNNITKSFDNGLHRPTMEGNISVIFIVLVFFLSVSLIFFVVEKLSCSRGE